MNSNGLVRVVELFATHLAGLAEAMRDFGEMSVGDCELRCAVDQLATLGRLLAAEEVAGDHLTDDGLEAAHLLAWLTVAELAVHLAVRDIVERAA
jgi:hypothetical protein